MNDGPLNEKAIFKVACKIDSVDARNDYLNQICGDDPNLFARVETLLRMHEDAPSFLESPPPGINITEVRPLTEQPGDQIGPYKLLQQIGEGGMGVVYMAEQTAPVERRVALKIIKPGMDTRQVIARFEAERQALAMMDHPNIAKVLDAGATDSGRPYFVMELVKGMPVTQYCDEQHLSPRERLELFVPICHAVQHAHQKGIIHRDLKPSNILIARYDDKPVPKIIDFGVAKATSQRLTEKTMFTQYGQIVGTMEYMSPEQANFNQLDVDTRSDIYSLGVLLYELLTGETPFDKKRLRSVTFDELLRIIREEEPPRPSTKLSSSQSLANTALNRKTEPKKLSLLVRGELDWIVMMALEKDRTRRYETASKFAEDVSHYLHHEAVLACPPSVTYCFRKFARRNKAVIATTVAIGLTLIAGIIGTTWQAIEAGHERDRAIDAESLAQERLTVVEAQKNMIETEKQKAVDEADRAAKAEDLAKQRLAEVNSEKQNVEQEKQIAEAAKDFLQNKLLGQADVETQADALLKIDGQVSEAKPNPTIRELLDRAATELSRENIEENFPSRPLLQAELLFTVGNAYRGVGAYDRAIDFLSRARELFEAELGPNHPDTLNTMVNLALAYQDAGKLDLALPLLEETLKIRKEKLGPDHPLTLLGMNNLAVAYQAAGKRDLALPLLEDTLKLQKAKLGPDHPGTLFGMNNLATAYHAAGKLDLALPLLEETLKIRKAKLGPDHPQTLASMNNLAAAYHAVGKHNLALPLYEETLKLVKKKLGPDHPNTLLCINNLAVAYQDAGKHDLALPLLEETLKIRKATLGPDHPDTLITMNNLAAAYHAAAKHDLALPLLEETLKLQKAKLGPDHPGTLIATNNLAVAYQDAGKLDLALPLLEETLKIRKATLGPDHPQTLASMNNLAAAYRAVGKHDLSLPLFEETLKLVKKMLGPDHRYTLTTMNNLARTYQDADKLDLALPLFEQVYEARMRSPDVESKFKIDAEGRYGLALHRVKRFVDAETHLLKSYENGVHCEGFPDDWIDSYIRGLIDLYSAWEKPDEVKKWQAELHQRKAARKDK